MHPKKDDALQLAKDDNTSSTVQNQGQQPGMGGMDYAQMNDAQMRWLIEDEETQVKQKKRKQQNQGSGTGAPTLNLPDLDHLQLPQEVVKHETIAHPDQLKAQNDQLAEAALNGTLPVHEAEHEPVVEGEKTQDPDYEAQVAADENGTALNSDKSGDDAQLTDQTTVKTETEPEIPYGSDITIKEELTDQQKERYDWEAVFGEFRAAHPNRVTDEDLEMWARKHLILGWQLGDPVPDITAVTVEFGIDYYYGRSVPTMLITAYEKPDARKEVKARDYGGFWRRVGPIYEEKVGFLQQPNSLQKFNKMHHRWSIELLDELHAVAGDDIRYQAAIDEGYIGNAFTKLVEAAQRKVMPKDFPYWGMYTAESREKVLERLGKIEEAEAAKMEANQGPIQADLSFVNSSWEKVDEVAMVYQNDGVFLWDNPSREGKKYKLVQYTNVLILKQSKHGWCLVSAIDSVSKEAMIGYASRAHLWKGVAQMEGEHAVTSYQIQKGDTAIGVAERFYGKDFISAETRRRVKEGYPGIFTDAWGQDLRFVVNAIYHVNYDMKKNKGNPHIGAGKWHDKFYKHGVEGSNWKAVELTAGEYLYLPSAFVLKQLKGQVSSGSITYEIYETVKDIAYGLYYGVAFGLGFVGGLVHGIVGFVYDLIADIVGLIGQIFEGLYQLITGELWGTIMDMIDLFTTLAQDPVKREAFFDEVLATLGDAIMTAIFGQYYDVLFTADLYNNPWKAGHRWGYTVAYFILNIILTIVSFGGGLAAKAGLKGGSILAKLLQILTKLEDLGDVGGLVRKVKGAKPDLDTQKAFKDVDNARYEKAVNSGDIDKPRGQNKHSDSPDTPEQKVFDRSDPELTGKADELKKELGGDAELKKRRAKEKENARKEIETDGKYKDGETDPKRKKEYDDRLAALTEAILITEGADEIDMAPIMLKQLLERLIPKFEFHYVKKSMGHYQIIMIGSRYMVDRDYTVLRETQPGGLTEAQDKASKNYDKAKKELEDLQGQPDLDVNSPEYLEALQKEREALYDMYKEVMNPAQRKKFDQVRDPEWKKKNNITPDEEDALLAEIYGNANLTDEVDDLLLRVRKEISTSGRKILLQADKIDNRLRTVTDKEHVYRIDSDGKIHGPVIGEKDKVDFNQLGPFKKGDIITHNHPSGATFSLDDIFNLSKLDITELRAVTKIKRYIIRKNGSFDYYKWRIKYDKLVSEFKVKYAEKFKQGMSFEDKVKIQEELYREAFKGTGVEFIID